MEELGLVALMLCILAAAAISQRIQGTILTRPMVYATLGFLLGSRVLGIFHAGPDNEVVRLRAAGVLVLLAWLGSYLGSGFFVTLVALLFLLQVGLDIRARLQNSAPEVKDHGATA